MFGQNNDQSNDQIPEHTIQGALQGDDTGSAAQPIIQPTSPPSQDNQQSGWGHPGTPLSSDTSPQAVTPQSSHVQSDTTIVGAPEASNGSLTNELIDIKQKALTQLSPLVSHLDQTPEDKFRTTMMMIQASDNQSLIPVAYEAANAITDEKAKAQALLDIVNEINYFTQQQQG